jgi:hypothetical protein
VLHHIDVLFLVNDLLLILLLFFRGVVLCLEEEGSKDVVSLPIGD